MTPTTSTSASSLWQYINDSMEQYGSLDLTSAATSKAPIVAGVGLVLDTRQQDALARLAGIEKQMSEMHGTADQTCGEELQEVGAVQNPALQELHHRLGKARVELQAAKEEDGVVVSRQHIHGAAFKSGRISNGDIICKVDGIPVGDVDTTVTLHLKKAACVEEEAVTLTRAVLPHPPPPP